MFLYLDESWISAAKAYCYQYPLETLEISYYLMNRAQLQQSGDNRNGRLYGYCEGDQLTALLLFNDKGIMYISNQSKRLFEKVDFLKTIHREKPRLIRGTEGQVDRVFYFLQRVLKHFKFVSTYLMAAKIDSAAPKNDNIAAGAAIDWHSHAAFLVEVEKAFRDRPLTINNLRQKLYDQRNVDFYSVYQQDGRPLGQVIGEFSTWQYGVIGGLYTSPQYRAKGLAKQLMNSAVARYSAAALTPLLYVVVENKAALALYKKIGFVELQTMKDLTIQL